MKRPANSAQLPTLEEYLALTDIDKLEKVQKRATKMIQGMENFKYPERLRQLELPTLAYRRNRGDMIVTYKLLSGLYDEQVTLQLMGTIGKYHSRKL